ncbi:YcaO-like family protein [Enhygromyxa salina]|uniref:YcaO-like family protein n=2 Tax=Enhygromyxa salina TaxID=215803 RepID=A0A2S9YTA2_9BACT|nr:YcaO-like family protein [Enhygromyxa salina]
MGYGTALDEPLARVRAVCEALERYCSVMYPLAGVRLARPGELDGAICEHSRFPQCSDRERQLGREQVRLPDPSREDYWIRGYSLSRGEPTWLPLTAVHLGLPIPVSEHVTWPMSTGFAAGSTYDQAVLSGLLEVIERDSLALWWLHQLPMPRLELQLEANSRLSTLLERAREIGLETHLFDLTTNLDVPVIGVVQVDHHARPHVITMGASRPRGIDAAIRVLEEAGSLRIAMANQAPITRSSFMSQPHRTPEEFGALYIDRDAIARFGFATDHPNVRHDVPPAVSDDPLDTIVGRLSALGMEVLVVDVTLPEVRQCGIVVVKVIVPDLMPISFCHDVRYLAHPRLYAAPRQLGYGQRLEAMITSDPIPFA